MRLRGFESRLSPYVERYPSWLKEAVRQNESRYPLVVELGRHVGLNSPINKLLERSIKIHYLIFVLIAMESSSVEEDLRSTNPSVLKNTA